MRTSQYYLSTLKEVPHDAELISHQLMLRAGMIRKLAAGIYSWLPLGLRVLRKVEAIVREEMNLAGALEVLLPAAQPEELWQETKRWDQYGRELLKFHDRHERSFCYGPTHEEVITDLLRSELRSYKQLPINFYQIQTKFRDEIRPRFGVMRGREFIMKDAYSFDISKEALVKSYQIMFQTYSRIFDRLGLKYRAVQADTGSIGGEASHEFQVLANSGEDLIAYSDSSDYAANIELAEAIAPTAPRPTSIKAMEKIATPNLSTIEEISKSLQVHPHSIVKTLIVKGTHHPAVALLLRGDHTLNEIKAEKRPEVAVPLTFVAESEILSTVGCKAGSIGPVGLQLPVIADQAVLQLSDFICGANEEGFHYINVNWERDLPEVPGFDLRKVEEGDPSPDGLGHLKLARGIEVGHIFQLGDKYSAAMNAQVLDESGKLVTLQMGCYGIGISRIVAAAIEQNHDERGIVWPKSLAPFDIALVPINYHRSSAVQEACELIYHTLQEAGFDVLLDDRNERPGVLFADMDLMGLPHRIVISERHLEKQVIEYKGRQDAESQQLPLDNLISFLHQ